MPKFLVKSWSKTIVFVLIAVSLLYYPLGGAMIEAIDKTLGYDIRVDAGKSVTLEATSFLIDREVNQHIWTPNLPLFFPSYFLDNMPAFQTGIIKATAVLTKPIVAQINCIEDKKEGKYLQEASELLLYPTDVWLFAHNNKLKIAPSSSTQYRKARKKIMDFNKAFKVNTCIWDKTPANLAAILSKIEKDLIKSAISIETQVNEMSSGFIDMNADNLFYKNQGKVYAYAILLKALGQDYKQVLIDKNLYQDWTKLIKSLEDAVEISPKVVINNSLDSGFSANHLIVLGYYIVKAENILIKLNSSLLREE